MKILLAAAVLAMIPTTAVLADASRHPADYVFPHGLPYAPSEDSCYTYRCVWDAKHQGNGKGQSMLLTRWHGGFIAKPITHHRAHRLQSAYCARKSVTCGGYAD